MFVEQEVISAEILPLLILTWSVRPSAQTANTSPPSPLSLPRASRATKVKFVTAPAVIRVCASSASSLRKRFREFKREAHERRQQAEIYVELLRQSAYQARVFHVECTNRQAKQDTTADRVF